MIFVVNWDNFQNKLVASNVYVLEHDDSWEMYAVMSTAEVLKCVVQKSSSGEQNMMFVDKYLADKRNIFKIAGIEKDSVSLRIMSEQEEIQPESVEMLPLDSVEPEKKEGSSHAEPGEE